MLPSRAQSYKEKNCNWFIFWGGQLSSVDLWLCHSLLQLVIIAAVECVICSQQCVSFSPQQQRHQSFSLRSLRVFFFASLQVSSIEATIQTNNHLRNFYLHAMKRKAISREITVKNSEFMNAIKQSVAERVARHEEIFQGVKKPGVVAALISSSNDSSVSRLKPVKSIKK